MYYEIKNRNEEHGHLISEKEIKGIFNNVIGAGNLKRRIMPFHISNVPGTKQ